MSSNNNLASYFQSNQHSKAVVSQDDDHFNNTTFQLKRTRSVGLLDEFIAPTKKLIEEQQEQENKENKENEKEDQITTSNTKHNAHNDDNEINEKISTPELIPHDDNDITYEPSRHVDYLSYNWKESDLSKSWKYIVLKRKDVANSARLENASWRTWAQAKYHLKTISPESVNWLKDSDVTWLYGPLYKDDSKKDDLKLKFEKIHNDLKLKFKLKPILKKRTFTELLSQPISPPKIDDNYDLISKKINSQYDLPSSPIILEKRHIHFNDRVEQCIAVNIPEDSDSEFESSTEEEDDESDDEGGFFLMVKSPSTSQLHNNLSLNKLQPVDKKKELKNYSTIELLPSTTLKNCEDEDEDEKFALSHNTNTSRGYNYYDYNSVFIGNPDNYHNINEFEIEDTPEHLEGVSMLDIPDDIVLGSNTPIQSPIETPIQSPLIKPKLKSASSFQLNSESESEDEDSKPFNFNKSPNFNEKISSSSSSFISLSDIAVHGIISSNEVNYDDKKFEYLKNWNK